jgi:hypothetical protein
VTLSAGGAGKTIPIGGYQDLPGGLRLLDAVYFDGSGIPAL